MFVVESAGSVVRLTDEYLKVELGEATIQGLRERVAEVPSLKSAFETLLRWVDYPLVWVSDIRSVTVEAVPMVPGEEQVFRLHLVAASRGCERTFDVHLAPEDAKKVQAEIEKLIGRKF